MPILTRKGIMLLCVMLFMASARAETISLNIGKHKIQAEVAATEASRNHGLMQRTQLCGDCGMLFVFGSAARHGFWMKDTVLPLALAFITRDGRILDITEMEANTTNAHFPPADILYALEMNSGWFARNDIRPGEMVRGLPLAPYAHQ